MTTDYDAKQRYQGDTASSYDDLRVNTPQWRREAQLLRQILSEIEPGSRILDVPVGTGRLLDTACELGHTVLGIDVSQDMLNEAQKMRAVASGCVELKLGEIESLPLEDKSVDYVFSVRFFNWISLAVVNSVLPELSRVAIRGLVLQVRVGRPASAAELLQQLTLNSLVRVVSGLKRRVRTGNMRISRRRDADGRSKTIVHREPDFEQALRDASLVVERSLHVNSRISLRQRWTESSSFYVLREDPASELPP